jgi:histone H1/5
VKDGRRRKSNSIIGHHRFRCHPSIPREEREKSEESQGETIKGLKERGGSSLQAIKKFVAANYKVDAEKVAPFIKKYLKGAVASGSLVQTKGKTAKKQASPKAKKTAAEKKSAAAASAAAAKAKKSAASSAEKKTRAAPKPRSPSKAKKSNKAGPTKKPKAPKPKTAKAIPVKVKKAASPKRKK